MSKGHREPYRFFSVKSEDLPDLMYNAQYDKDIIVGRWKLIEFSNLFNGATIFIKRAEENKENEIVKQFLYLRSAIIDYNACYDYVLQIIYFAFGFCGDFNSQDEYIKQLEKSVKLIENGDKTEFAKNLDKLAISNTEFNDFYKKIKKYRGNGDNYKTAISKHSLRTLANNIKHQGGFAFSEFWEKENVGDFVIRNSIDNSLIFTTEQLHIYSPSIKEVFELLYNHNKNLFTLSSLIYNSLFPTKKFSFNHHGWGDNNHIKISLEHYTNGTEQTK